LREENIKVDRRPADRPAGEADFESFKEGTLELVETSEEVVVSKRARVVEELVIAKEVSHRTEIVRDRVRQMNVEVERLGAESARQTGDFEEYENELRNNYNANFSKSDYSYEQFLPAYRYGYTLANDKRYSSGDWKSIEPDARRYWEESNKGTWEEFKNAVRYAWEKVRHQR
jgi:DNA mismatch repair ATPase MutS